MSINSRHLAAAQFTGIATFCASTWWSLLFPINEAAEQLRLIFAPGYELRPFFTWLAVSSIVTTAVAMSYWFRPAAARPCSSVLLGVSVVLFGLALWWFDVTFIFAYGLGLFFAAWVWLGSNTAIKRGRAANPVNSHARTPHGR